MLLFWVLVKSLVTSLKSQVLTVKSVQLYKSSFEDDVDGSFHSKC